MALNGGYHVAFVVGAGFAAAAATLGAALLRPRVAAPAPQGEPPVSVGAVAEAD